MSIPGWFCRLRVDLLSSSGHWAEVMAEADALQAEHDGEALAVAHRQERAAKGEHARALFRDVGCVLEAREALSEPRRRPVRG